MSISRLGWFVCLAVAPLHAGAIDVSSQSSVTLYDGDTLTFAISAFSYQVHAPALGAPAAPPFVSFALLTAPLPGAPDLAFSLESYSGGVSIAIDDASLLPGYFQGSFYNGPISMESGSLALSAGLSGQVFAGPAVFLAIEDMGGPVTLGLSPYSLKQSLEVTLSGGGFSVGGTVAAVTLEPLSDAPPGGAVVERLSADAPEPRPGALLALGGACLVLLAQFAKRRRASN
jgi:hypothetical protein